MSDVSEALKSIITERKALVEDYQALSPYGQMFAADWLIVHMDESALEVFRKAIEVGYKMEDEHGKRSNGTTATANA